jgi:hypothetical protein
VSALNDVTELVKILARQSVVLCLAEAVSRSKDSGRETYYVRLVRGSNDAHPPEPGSTATGPKVAAQLQTMRSRIKPWLAPPRTLKTLLIPTPSLGSR